MNDDDRVIRARRQGFFLCLGAIVCGGLVFAISATIPERFDYWPAAAALGLVGALLVIGVLVCVLVAFLPHGDTKKPGDHA